MNARDHDVLDANATLVPPGGCDGSIVRCGLMSDYFDHLLDESATTGHSCAAASMSSPALCADIPPSSS